MKKQIERVTVTGADDSVDPLDLVRIAEKFPFVEFGILVSPKQFGRPRWPSVGWMNAFERAIQGKSIKVAGHICGEWVRDIFMGEWPFYGMPYSLFRVASRWQLNTHGEKHGYRIRGFMNHLAELTKAGQEVIFQYDKVNLEPLSAAADLGLKVSALYDLSHGAGVLPSEWEVPVDLHGRPLTVPCGYAGGLSPGIVAEQIELIQGATDRPFWIDAETWLRSADDSRFDLDKVSRFLEAARPYVVGV